MVMELVPEAFEALTAKAATHRPAASIVCVDDVPAVSETPANLDAVVPEADAGVAPSVRIVGVATSAPAARLPYLMRFRRLRPESWRASPDDSS
jgi:hypothetical protein